MGSANLPFYYCSTISHHGGIRRAGNYNNPSRADEHAACFMEPMMKAEPELKVADRNDLLLRFKVIKSMKWPPDIVAG